MMRAVRMSSLVTLLLSACVSLGQAVGMETIHTCQTRCSKGLRCKSQPHYSLAPCRAEPEDLNTTLLHNVSVSTAIRCEGKQRCSLHLRIAATLLLHERVQGVSMCVAAAGMMERCRLFSLPRRGRERLAGQQVKFESDCFNVGPGQDVRVSVKTVPHYCGLTWTGSYHAPGCSSEDLRSNIPECITGRLAYTDDPDHRQLSVGVSDMLQDHDYHLRLCYRGYTCSSAGASALIKKDVAVKNATLEYSRPLPCLCIEGWSATVDAPRVQVCPFKDRLEELWSGVHFDPAAEALSWEMTCSVAAVISLCQLGEDGMCVDLVNASQTSRSRGDKITFSKVDPHPALCMKFVTEAGSWTRCPFAEGSFQAWQVGVTNRGGVEQLMALTSRIRVDVSVGVCVKTGSSSCRPVDTHLIHVDRSESVGLNLTEDICQPNTCIQVKRHGVKYAATILHCDLRCSLGTPSPPPPAPGTWDVTRVAVLAGVCLTSVALAVLLLNILLTFHQRKEMGGVSKEPQGLVAECVTTPLQTDSFLQKHVSPTETPKHVSPTETPQHVSPTETPQHVSPTETPQHVSPTETPQHVSPTETPQHVSPTETPQHVSPTETPQHVSPTETPQHVSPTETPQHVSPTETPQFEHSEKATLLTGFPS